MALPTGVLTGLAGSMMAAPLVVSMGAGTQSVLDPGFYYGYAAGANVSIQLNTDGAATWTTMIAAGIANGVFFYADGVSVRLNNAGAGTQSMTLVRVKGMP